MILLPIGHEEEGTRRLPWVTFGIMILCALAFVATGFGGSRTEFETLDATEDAAEYWIEHPYLRLDPRLEATMHGPGTRRDAREAFREGMKTFSEAPDDPETLAAEQAELDRLTQVAMNTTPSHPFYRFGLVPSKFSFVALFTHMFLHAGWLHLLGNLFILYLAGPFVEDVWGRPLYAAFYGVCGVVAALSFALPHLTLAEPMVGASGAIAGVMGAFAVRYAGTKIHMFWAVGLWMRGTFWAPAWAMLGIWFAQQVFYAVLTHGSAGEAGGGVAFLAHVGGFVAGAGIAFGMKRARAEERWLADSIDAKANKRLVDHAEVAAALELAAAGNAEGAFARLQAEVGRTPANGDAVLAWWSVALDLGRARDVAPAMARLVHEEARRGQVDLAIDHWLELREKVPAIAVEPLTLVRLAGVLGERGHVKEAVEALKRALMSAGKAPTPATALRIAAAAAELDPAVARAAIQVALARPDLDAAGRRQAETLRDRLLTAPR